MVKISVLMVLAIGFLMFRSTVVPGGSQDIYIAKVSAGGNTGADCADALPETFFNTSSNWAASFSAGKISPGTTVHLCGTFTAATQNTTELTTQGNGLTGSPITVLFESGAVLASPAWSTNGAIRVPNNFIVIDGGTNGTIENTNDGTPGGACLSTCSVQFGAPVGVDVTGSNVTVQNLTVTHLTMHTFQANDSTFSGLTGQAFFQGTAISLNGANDTATQNTIDNSYTGISGNNGSTISYNTITFVNHGIAIGDVSSVWSGISINNNDISQEYTWDQPDNAYHHNDIMLFVTASGGQIIGTQIYDNYMHGLNSNDNIYGDSHITNAIFIDANGIADSIPNTIIVRNIVGFTSAPCVVSGGGTCPHGVGKELDYATNGAMGVGSCRATPCSPPDLSLIANNTVVGPVGGPGCWGLGEISNNASSMNNICATTSGAQVVYPSSIPFPASGAGVVDFNLYPGVPTSNAFCITTGPPPANACSNVNSWTVWHNSPYFFDQHCTPTGNTPGTGNSCNPALASAALTASYHLSSGSVAIGAAKNLTSLWCGIIPPLCTGAPSTFGRGGANDGFALPSGTTAWDTGAYPFAGIVALAPASYTFATTVAGSGSSSDSPVTFTVTNSTGATITGITISLSGANPGDFSKTTTCGSSLTNSSSCTISLTFTPTAVGSRTAILNVSDSDSGSPHTSSLSGTAIPSVTNPSPANPVTFGVVVTDPSIRAPVKNEKQNENLPACNFDYADLVGFLHKERTRYASGASASQ